MSAGSAESAPAPVRSLFRAAQVDGAKPPCDRLLLRAFYPARPAQSAAERDSGVLQADAARAPLPSVIFMPGVNCDPSGYRWLAEGLAERGWLALTYAFVAEEMPGAPALTPGLNLDALRPDSYGQRPSSTVLPALLGAMERLNESGPLRGLLDTGRVALGGHSAGGSAALLNAHPGWFPQLAAAFSYGAHTGASTILGHAPGSHLKVPPQLPLLLMGGERDGVIAASRGRYGEPDGDASGPIERSFRESVAGGRGDAWLAILAGANHFAPVHPEDHSSGRPFLDWRPERPPQEIRATLLELCADFLDAHVRDDMAARESLVKKLEAGGPCIAKWECK